MFRLVNGENSGVVVEYAYSLIEFFEFVNSLIIKNMCRYDVNKNKTKMLLDVIINIAVVIYSLHLSC